MKRCFKCGQHKPLSEFYKHSEMADGHLNKCKDCTKLDVRTHRAGSERVREYDRRRASLPHRKAMRAKVSEAWRKRHPERKNAATRAKRANLEAPNQCEGCGLMKRLEKHHQDYSKPLLVVWLCKPCHAIADKIRRRLEAS